MKSKINPIYNNQLPVWYDNGVPQFHIPVQLSCLRLAEKMLLQLVSPFVPQQYINNGTFGLKGHVCCFPQDIGEVAKVLPRLPSDVKMIKLVRQVTTAVGGPRTNKSFSVRRKETLEALLWLKDHNVLYKDVTIDCSQLNWMQSEDETDISPHIQEIFDKESKSVADDSDVSDNKSVIIDEVNNKRDLFYDVEEVERPFPFLDVLDDLGPAPGQVMAPREDNREEYIPAFGIHCDNTHVHASQEDAKIGDAVRTTAKVTQPSQTTTLFWPTIGTKALSKYDKTIKIFAMAFF